MIKTCLAAVAAMIATGADAASFAQDLELVQRRGGFGKGKRTRSVGGGRGNKSGKKTGRRFLGRQKSSKLNSSKPYQLKVIVC